MMVRAGCTFSLFAGVLLVLSACSSEPAVPLAPEVNLQRYSGRWYIIANIPYFAERGAVGSYFEISFDGSELQDTYYKHSHSFDAPLSSFVMRGYVVPGTGNARWRESPMWPLYFSYLILYTDADYRTALVGYPGRGYGWVLSRTRDMDAAAYAGLLLRFKALGYDTSRFRRVPQNSGQIGQNGFQ